MRTVDGGGAGNLEPKSSCNVVVDIRMFKAGIFLNLWKCYSISPIWLPNMIAMHLCVRACSIDFVVVPCLVYYSSSGGTRLQAKIFEGWQAICSTEYEKGGKGGAFYVFLLFSAFCLDPYTNWASLSWFHECDLYPLHNILRFS